MLWTMDFKASKGGKGSLVTQNKKFKYPEKAIDAGKKYPPALPVTPKKKHLPLDRCHPLVPWGQKYLHLINPCWLLLTPPPQNPGVPMPPSTQVFSKIKHPLASHPPQPASHHPLPVEDGWMGARCRPGSLCWEAAGVAASLLSAGASGSAMQPLEAAR